MDPQTIERNVGLVRQQIETAARRAGRDPAGVRLLAATKQVDADRIRAAIRAGVYILGESRLQEAVPKIQRLGAGERLEWHFIGRLQRRKVKAVVGVFRMIHSVDSVELAREIDRRAAAAGLQQPVLLEVNLAAEPSKAGVASDALLETLHAVDELPHVAVMGLMTIPPPGNAEFARPFFRRLRELAASAAREPWRRCRMQELSMGMSADFETAVEEGATLVRIGTALFGARDG